MEDKLKPPEVPEPMDTLDEEGRRDSNDLVIDEDRTEEDAGLRPVATAGINEPQPQTPPSHVSEPEQMEETEAQHPVQPVVPEKPMEVSVVAEHPDSEDEDVLPVPSQDQTPQPPPPLKRETVAGPSVPRVQTVLSRGTGSRILAKERQINDDTHAYDPEHPANALRLHIEDLIRERKLDHDAGREKALGPADKELFKKPIKEWTFRRGFKAKSKANIKEFEFSKKLAASNKERKELLERHNEEVLVRGPYNTKQLTREVLHNPNLARTAEAKERLQEAVKKNEKLQDLTAPTNAPIHPVKNARQTFFPRGDGYQGTEPKKVKAKVDTNLAGSRAAGLDYIGTMKKSKSKSLGNLPAPPPTPVNVPKSPPNRGRTPKRKKTVPPSPTSPQQGKEKKQHTETRCSGGSSSGTKVDETKEKFTIDRVLEPLKDMNVKCDLVESFKYLRLVKQKIHEMKPNTWLLRFRGNPFFKNFHPEISAEIQGQLDYLEEIGDVDTLDAFNAILVDMWNLTWLESGHGRFKNAEVIEIQGGIELKRRIDYETEFNHIQTIFVGKLKEGIELPSLTHCEFISGRIAEENEQGIRLITEDMIPKDQLEDFADFIGRPCNEIWTVVEANHLTYQDGLTFARNSCINYPSFDALLVKVIGGIRGRSDYYKVVTYYDLACLIHQHPHADFSNVDDQSIYSKLLRLVYRQDGVPVDHIFIPMPMNDSYPCFMVRVTPANSSILIFSASQPKVKFSEFIRKDVPDRKRVKSELRFLKKLMEAVFYKNFNEDEPKWPSDSLFAANPHIIATTNRTKGMYTAILWAEFLAAADEDADKQKVLQHSMFSDTLPLPLTDPRCYYLKLMNGTLPVPINAIGQED